MIATTAAPNEDEEDIVDSNNNPTVVLPSLPTAVSACSGGGGGGVAPPPRWILPVLVVTQFLGTALWFAPNAIFSKLILHLHLTEGDISYLTSAVQLGFIVGTLVFAMFSIADRLRPTRVFLVCSIFGALSNVAVIWVGGLAGLLLLRTMTGFFLAGIYPVGMKVAADWYQPLGPALGVLVGALVLGSALPFLLHNIPQSWQALLIETSAGAVVAGLVMGCIIPDGPHRQPATRFQPMVVLHLFDNADFSAACLGYFGHMWEVYAMWAYLPHVWKAYTKQTSTTTAASNQKMDFIVFGIIAMGSFGCALGGWLSIRYGSALVATASLVLSGLFCALSPVFFLLPFPLTLILYLLWGMAVAADSPQFSTLVAQTAPPHVKGSALTLSTCIGFALTIASIQLLGAVADPLSAQYLFLWLVPGPVCGVWYMRKLVRKEHNDKKERQQLQVSSLFNLEKRKVPSEVILQKEVTFSENSVSD